MHEKPIHPAVEEALKWAISELTRKVRSGDFGSITFILEGGVVTRSNEEKSTFSPARKQIQKG